MKRVREVRLEKLSLTVLRGVRLVQVRLEIVPKKVGSVKKLG